MNHMNQNPTINNINPPNILKNTHPKNLKALTEPVYRQFLILIPNKMI